MREQRRTNNQVKSRTVRRNEDQIATKAMSEGRHQKRGRRKRKGERARKRSKIEFIRTNMKAKRMRNAGE